MSGSGWSGGYSSVWQGSSWQGGGWNGGRGQKGSTKPLAGHEGKGKAAAEGGAEGDTVRIPDPQEHQRLQLLAAVQAGSMRAVTSSDFLLRVEKQFAPILLIKSGVF